MQWKPCCNHLFDIFKEDIVSFASNAKEFILWKETLSTGKECQNTEPVWKPKFPLCKEDLHLQRPPQTLPLEEKVFKEPQVGHFARFLVNSLHLL